MYFLKRKSDKNSTCLDKGGSRENANEARAGRARGREEE